MIPFLLATEKLTKFLRGFCVSQNLVKALKSRTVYQKAALIITSTLLFCTPTLAQEFKWAVRSGRGQHITRDTQNNLYVTGSFTGSLTLGSTTLTSSGGQDIFIAKYTTAGTVVWAKRIGGTGDDIGNGITTDSEGNIYVISTVKSSSLTLENQPLTNLGTEGDILLVKYNTSGNLLWHSQTGGTGNDTGLSVATDSRNNVYIAGTTASTSAAFGTISLASRGGDDVYLVKYNSTGTSQWGRRYGSTENEFGGYIAVDGADNVHLAFNFRGVMNVSVTNLNSAGSADIALMRFTETGNILSANRFGGSLNDQVHAVKSDAEGNVYVTGNFSSAQIAFGSTTLQNSGNADIFLAKLDDSNFIRWATRAGSSGEDSGTDLIAGNDHVYLTGYFKSDTLTFPNIKLANTSTGTAEMFVASYSANGSVVWAQQAGGNSEDISRSITLDTDNYLYITGSFASLRGNFGNLSFIQGGVGFVSRINTNAPFIYSLTPRFSRIGDLITIRGINFSDVASVRFNGIDATFTVVSATELTATVPTNATTGQLVVESPAGLAISHDVITVVSSPVISALTPSSSHVGSVISIDGSNFVEVSAVRFNNLPATFQVISPTRIEVTVPQNATNGPVSVTNLAGTGSSPTNFTVTARPPSFCLSNAEGRSPLSFTSTFQSVIMPSGKGYYWPFTAEQGVTYSFSSCGSSEDTYIRIYNSSSVVASNDDSGPYCSSTNASIDWICPSAGTYYVLLTSYTCNPLYYNTTFYYKATPVVTPTIISFSPSSGYAGQSVTITGSDFRAISSVRFNNAQATFTVVSPTQISAVIPANATTGIISVSNTGGTASSTSNFTVTERPPSFCLSNTEARAPLAFTSTFQSVTVSGGRGYYWPFTAEQGTTYSFSTCGSTDNTFLRIYNQTSVVASNDDAGPYCTGTNASMDWTCTSSGVYYVLLTQANCSPLWSSNTLMYKTSPSVVSRPTVSSFSPATGHAGQTVTITGTNFQAIGSVRFNTVSANYIVRSETQIDAVVPANATTGPVSVTNTAGTGSSAGNFTITVAPPTPPSFCLSNAEQRSTLTFTNTFQATSVTSGRGYYWPFTAVQGTTYSFSTCGSMEDTYIRIYNSSSVVASNDDAGPYCSSNSASIDWVCPSSGTYYVLLTSYPCGPLYFNTTFYHKSGSASGPTVNFFSPSSGNAGQTVTITGTNFQSVNAVRFNNINASYIVRSTTQIDAVVPANATTGLISVSTSGGTATSASNFTINAATPTFCLSNAEGRSPLTFTNTFQATSVSSGRGYYWPFTAVQGTTYSFSSCGSMEDTYIRIYNSSTLEAYNDDSGPYCNGSNASIDWLCTSSGTYYVLLTQFSCSPLQLNTSLYYKAFSTTSQFAPVINSYIPSSGNPGTTVTISGSNLLDVNRVLFNGLNAGYYVINNTQLTVIVPENATTGPITIENRSGVFTTSSSFTIGTATSLPVTKTDQEGLKLYPNPARHTVLLRLENAKGSKATIVMHNLLGQPVLQKEVTIAGNLLQQQLDLQMLPKGVYLITITTDDGTIQKKLVKE
jgi:uncharacterized protein YmfQ (DUF2313 family)